MLRFWDPRELRERPWASAVVLSLALLILPTIAWLVAPHVGGFAAPAAPHRVATSPAAPAQAEPEPPEDSRTRPALAGEAAQPASETTAEPEEEGIAGTVVDQDGKPVEGANVVCTDRADLTTSTEKDGRFKLPLGADGCKAVAMHPEFSPSREQRVDAGRTTELRMGAGGSIEGLVVDERGAGVTPVLVAVESFVATGGAATAPKPNRRAKSFEAKNGSFTLAKLAPGKYVLTASAEGRPPAHSDPVDVESGRAVRGVKIILARGGRIAGRVVDHETKKPVPGAVVSLDSTTDSQANGVKNATTDEAGAFTLDGAPAGPFSLRVAHLDFNTKVVPSLTSTTSGTPPRVEVELTRRADAGVEAQVGGIGVHISPLADALHVLFLIPNGPAAQAGLQMMDEVVRIDGVNVKSLSIDECARRLRGPVGTRVVVSVNRADGPMDFTITRADLTTLAP